MKFLLYLFLIYVNFSSVFSSCTPLHDNTLFTYHCLFIERDFLEIVLDKSPERKDESAAGDFMLDWPSGQESHI